MLHTIANAIVGGMSGAILAYNLIMNDYITVVLVMVGWVGFLVYIGTSKGE